MFGIKRESRDVLLVDLRSDSVGVVLVTTHRDGLPEIKYCSRENLAIQSKFESSDLMPRLQSALGKMLRKLSGISLPHPSEVHVTLGSPWFHSQTRMVEHDKGGESFVFDEDLYDEIALGEVSCFGGEQYFDNPGLVVELEPVSFKLNGYDTKVAYGREVNKVSVELYMSLADAEFMTNIEEIIERSYPNSKIEFHSFPYASMSVIDTVLGEGIKSYVFADINGEMTELSIVKDGHIAALSSFPKGAHAITRHIASALKTNMSEAGTLFRSYQSGTLSPKIREKVEKAVNTVREEWKEDLHKALLGLSSQVFLPERFIAAGETATMPLFCDCVREEDVTRLTTKNTPFSVVALSSDYLKRHYENSSKGPLDVFLVMESLFVDMIHDIS